MRRSVLLAAVASLAFASATTNARAENGVQVTARFDEGAQLAEPTAMHVALSVDPERHPAPIAALSVQYPASLGIATGGLGLEPCRPPVRKFQLVMVDGIGLGGCSPNSVMGYGSARAQVRLGTLTIGATAHLTVLVGPVTNGQMSLVTYVIGQNPFGVRLAYAGRVQDAPPTLEELSIAFPAIPGLPEDATFALTRVTMTIGGERIAYRDPQGLRYRPDGVLLPGSCPRGGFTFKARLAFADRTSATATTRVRCPPRPRQATPFDWPPAVEENSPTDKRAQRRGLGDSTRSGSR